MITKEDYNKAMEIIKEYDKQLNIELVKEYKCCKCEENTITPIFPENTRPLGQEFGMCLNGVIENITFRYGSKKDMESYYIAICDDCITDLHNRGIVKNVRDVRMALKLYIG